MPHIEVGKGSSITFFILGDFLVTFSDASVTLFLSLSWQTPFAGLLFAAALKHVLSVGGVFAQIVARSEALAFENL